MATRVFPYLKTSAPTVNDDTGDGYKVGDLWLDTTNDLIYEAIDVTLGAAVWIEFVGRTQTQILTNKSIDLASNTLTATSLQIKTAVSDETGSGALVFGTAPTLGAPVIADFTSAAHDHEDADDGGVLVAAAITGLHGYHLVASTDALSPADATTYYFGTPLALNFTTGATTARIDIPKAGTITRVWMHWRPGTVGSNEQSTVSLRLNDTSDTTITSTLDLSASAYITTVVSIAVAVGDYVTFKWLTPTWVTTNPANVEVYGGIWIDRT